jgi:hypothetical protein
MKRRALLLSVSAMLPAAALAQSSDTYQCTMNGMQRRVEIVRESAARVPCEVVYFKDSEAPGERYVLWNALNEVNYCESQAEGFVEQLESWGWSCDAPEAAASTEPAEAPAADDSDVLSAAQ